MRFLHPRQKFFASRQQAYLDASAITFTGMASYQTERFATRYQRYSAVMFGLQALGDFTDGRTLTTRKTLQVQ